MDTSKILDFIGSNVSRNNRFDFILNIPNLIELNKYTTTTNKDILRFYIIDANIPGISLTLKEVFYLGKMKHTSIRQGIEGLTIVFYDTKEQLIRQFFMDWFNAINPTDSYEALKYYPSDYMTSAKFTAENKEFIIEGIVPANVNDFQASHNNSSSLGTFSVQFKVKYLK